MKEKFKDYYKIIGANIRKVRIEKGYSQQDLANRCSVDRAKISRIENATEDFMFKTFLEIVEALEITPTELLKDLSDTEVQ